MSIVTKTGDAGKTSLMYGRRVSKSDARVEAGGAIDELTAALGLARAFAAHPFICDQILAVQKDLILLMGEVATHPSDAERYAKDGFDHITSEMVDRLGAVITKLEQDESLHPKDWVIPGASQASSALDLARTACRRAERRVVAISADDGTPNPEIVRYLNRLSDLCWLLARYTEHYSEPEEA
jgi:cob(I)alamin adenosyltransferase